MLSELNLAYVDLETTGARAADDRITEIAVVTVRGGNELAWESLVQPHCEVPRFIQQLTGIDAALLAGAPDFERLAEDLLRRLEGAVLVAHNARFDAGFLRAAFTRCGLHYRPKRLCTLKLARALYPDWPRHGLDALCMMIGYHREQSHRAMADVRAMMAFVEYAVADLGEDRVFSEISIQMSRGGGGSKRRVAGPELSPSRSKS